MAMLGEGMQARPDDPVVVVTDNPQPVAAAVGNATACDLEINPCAMRLWLLVAAGFTATVLSASLAFDWWDGLGDYGTTLGYAGVVVFGLMTCRLIWMLPAERGPAVIVTPYGIRDLRIGNEFLLWDSIAAISVDGGPGRKAIVLTLTAALQRQRCTTCAKSRAAPTDRIVIPWRGWRPILIQCCVLVAIFMLRAIQAPHCSRKMNAARKTVLKASPYKRHKIAARSSLCCGAGPAHPR